MTVIRIHKQLGFGPRPISGKGKDLVLLKNQTKQLIQKLSAPGTGAAGQSCVKNTDVLKDKS